MYLITESSVMDKIWKDFWLIQCYENKLSYVKQGRIVNKSGLNNENNKNLDKNILKSKIKDFMFYSTRVKADVFWVKETN